eukprot:sb/3474063/
MLIKFEIDWTRFEKVVCKFGKKASVYISTITWSFYVSRSETGLNLATRWSQGLKMCQNMFIPLGPDDAKTQPLFRALLWQNGDRYELTLFRSSAFLYLGSQLGLHYFALAVSIVFLVNIRKFHPSMILLSCKNTTAVKYGLF